MFYFFRCFFVFFSFSFSCAGGELKKECFPILNLDRFFSEDVLEREQFVLRAGEALNDFGFFALINHGMNEELLSEAYRVVNAFFSLSEEQKKKYEGVVKNRGFRGFDPNRKDKAPDLQEYWHVGRETALNVWPQEILGFKQTLLNLYVKAEELSQVLLEACALAIGEEKAFLKEKAARGDSILRVIHYKEKQLECPSDVFWKAPHRDPNVLTLIMGISSEGLQIERPNGRWFSVPLIEGAIIVSASNLLEHLSNGYFKSTLHRVVNAKHSSRYAIAFFVHFDREVVLSPSKRVLEKTGRPPLYPTIKVEKALEDHDWFENTNHY